MNTYISILRGINVSGKNLIKMTELRQLYLNLGFINIQTYIQSGNVVFQTELSDIKVLESLISEGISNNFGFKVPVIVFTNNSLQSALNNNSFLSDSTKDPAFIHFTFLSDIPQKELVDKIAEKDYTPDEYSFDDKTIFLYCPTGYGNTKLTNSFFEKKLRVTATTRNLQTVKQLISLSSGTNN
jgi:uncharacterized protein (DUF1697 family)